MKRSRKPTPIYIYMNSSGEIYMVRAVYNGSVIEYPVSNTGIRTVKSAMSALYGKIDCFTVQVLDNDERSC